MNSGRDRATTIDRALGERLALRQPAKGYRFAVDPIILAACCPAHSGDRVADLGCGIGTAALAIARLRAGVTCVGIDKQPALIDLAIENAARNGLDKRVSFHVGDIHDRKGRLGSGAFDVAVANPPYLDRATATLSRDSAKALATAVDEGGIAAWCKAAYRCVRNRGAALFIHRADRLDTVLCCFAERFGGIVILPIHPRVGEPAHRFIILGRKGSRKPMRLLHGVALHMADGGWTELATRLLRHGGLMDLEGGAGAELAPGGAMAD